MYAAYNITQEYAFVRAMHTSFFAFYSSSHNLLLISDPAPWPARYLDLSPNLVSNLYRSWKLIRPFSHRPLHRPAHLLRLGSYGPCAIICLPTKMTSVNPSLTSQTVDEQPQE